MSSPKITNVTRTYLLITSFLYLTAAAWPAQAQGNITTVAGNGSAAFSWDNGPAVITGLNHPRGLAVDSGGSLYISDVDNMRIRRVSPTGMITTVAGNGIAGGTGDGGLAVNASLSSLTALALDGAGNLYVADAHNMRVRKVAPNGIITTVAGTGVQGYSGDGGPATSAQLNVPASVMFAGGNLYISDSSNQRIRRVSSNGTITTVAGNGSGGYSGDGGLATSASLNFPLGMAMDSQGNLYFADGDNNRVRRISPSGIITTVAGNGAGTFAGDQGPATGASINIPEDVAIDGTGNLYIADAGNNRIRKVDGSGFISTVAGTAENGFSGDGGPATQANLSFPWGLAANTAGVVYIADRVNNRVRIVSASPTGAPYLADTSTVNVASFAQTGVAPGTIISLLGSDLANGYLSASSEPLPTALGDTSVTFNGIAAPLLFVSSSQIYAQAPFELPTGVAASIQVKRGSATSAPRTVNVPAVSPGIFIADWASGAAAVLHAADYSLVGSNSPARPGENLLIYCTGLGAVQTPVGSGAGAPNNAALAQTVNAPIVTIAGLPATVTYSGLAPGYVGLYQISVQAPTGMPAGTQSLQINALGVASSIATIVTAQ